jgi:hypothetical protein
MTGAEVTRVTEARVVFRMRVSVSPIALLGSSLAALALACSGMTVPTVVARLSLNASSYLAVPQGLEGSLQLMYTGDVCDVPAGCRSKPFTVRMGK